MKIKITDLDNVIEVQEILRDMNIKQPTYGYSDVFTIPNDMKDEVFDLFRRKNIKWTKSSKNESKLSKWINKIINEEVRKVRLKESSETKILMSGQSSFMKRFAVPQFKKAGIQYKVDDDGDILEIRASGDEKLIEKISSFLETKDSNGDYGGWFIDESRIRENSESEIDDIAVDLIDYMGKQLPPQGWAKDKRIIGFFREQGLTDPKMVQQIYNRALKMNRE